MKIIFKTSRTRKRLLCCPKQADFWACYPPLSHHTFYSEVAPPPPSPPRHCWARSIPLGLLGSSHGNRESWPRYVLCTCLPAALVKVFLLGCGGRHVGHSWGYQSGSFWCCKLWNKKLTRDKIMCYLHINLYNDVVHMFILGKGGGECLRLRLMLVCCVILFVLI